MPVTYPTAAGLPGRWSYLYIEPMKLMGDNTGFTSTVTFETDFSNLADFVTYMGGVSQAITAGANTFNRILPMQHPLYSSLYLTKVDCEAFGDASETSEALIDLWARAKVRAEYKTPPYNVTGSDAYMQWQVDQGSVYTTAPGRKFAFSDGEPIDQDAGGFATLNQYSLTLHQCPNLNDTAIDLLTNTFNNDVYRGRPAGSLLFGGCKSNFDTSIGGVTRYTRVLMFTYRAYHWNQVFKRSGVLDTPLDPAGNPLYQPGDFTQLFQ